MNNYVAQQGDLVTYKGPPILYPPRWELITKNNNGIINIDDIGIVVQADIFLRIADVYFDQVNITIKRISFRYLVCL